MPAAAHGVSDDRVHAWMQRQQEEAFAVAPLAKLAGGGIRT